MCSLTPHFHRTSQRKNKVESTGGEIELSYPLKSVNSNLTLAVHSPKLGQAKTHFLSHFGGKKRKNMARPGFEPMISRSEVGLANQYSIGPLIKKLGNLFM